MSDGNGAQSSVARGFRSCHSGSSTLDACQRHAVLQSCPFHLRGRFRHIARMVLEARSDASLAHDTVKETRVWKLFCFLPFLLLRRPLDKSSLQSRVEFKMIAVRRGRFDVLVRELSNVQERQPQIYGDDSRDPRESCVPESSCGRGVPSTTVFDRSRVGARFPGDSARNAEQASAGGGPTNPGGCVELHPRVTSEVGPTEVSGEFEECSTGVFSGTRRMHLRTL